MPPIVQEMANAMLRHALTGAGSVLVAQGYASDSQVNAVVGGVMAAIGIFLSYQHKSKMLAAQPQSKDQ